ncbi:pleckstrin homology domain-containing family A member 7 isoform X1 [Tachysurus ichikawai]
MRRSMSWFMWWSIRGSKRCQEVQLMISVPVTLGSHPEPTFSPYTNLQPEELTLLLVQLRRHQAKMADAFAHLNDGLSGPSLQADDTYLQLKKDLEYLDLKVKLFIFRFLFFTCFPVSGSVSSY